MSHGNIAWADNSHTGGANANDRLVVVLYAPEIEDVSSFFTDTTRSQGSCRLAIGNLKGEHLVYATFIAAKGNAVSNSYFVGCC